MKISEIRKIARDKLLAAGIEDAAYDADEIIGFVTEIDRSNLPFYGDTLLDSAQEEQIPSLIEKRANRVPLQHILGFTWFYGRKFLVNSDVLIPRPETEVLVENALKYIRPSHRVLDLCTGSGCIAISIEREYKEGDLSVTASDISENALKVAKLNGERLSSKVAFITSDLTLSIPKGAFYDIITANPPYISTLDKESLSAEVRQDPDLALFAGEDGLSIYRRLAQEIPGILAPGGTIFLEIGCEQGYAVSELFRGAGFNNIEIIMDYAGLDRVVKIC